MGLLLSVLVVCVGVLEVIACVRHFQDGYLPLWTPHCAVTSGFAITHDRWRKLPSFDYAKNDDEKRFEDLTAAKNGAVALGLQGDSVKSVDNFGKNLHSAATLQEDQKVISEIHLQQSETTFVTQKISDSLAFANEDKINNLTADVHKQTVTNVFQSDIYNNNLVQTEVDIATVHPEESTLTSDQDIQKQYEAATKQPEFFQQPPEPGKSEDISTVHPEESTLTSDQDIEKQYEAATKQPELVQQPPKPGRSEDISTGHPEESTLTSDQYIKWQDEAATKETELVQQPPKPGKSEDISTVHPEESTLTSDKDIEKQHEAAVKKIELIQPGKSEDIPDDSLKPVEKHEDDDTHETTVVDTTHHEEITLATKYNSSESGSRLEPQTSSDTDITQPKGIETQSQETLDFELKTEETPEELIQTLKKTPSPVRISPPSSTPPLTPKKSKADISWPTFFPGAPVIKRPSVSFATPEALLAGEDPEPHTRNDEEERPATPATPPPIIKRSKENTPVPAELESRSMSSESLSEDFPQEEEDEEDENLFRGIREKSPASIISGNDFSKKELELQRRKSYKLKRFNSAVETVSRDEEAEDRSFSEDKKDMSHAVKSKEPKRRFKKPVKATSFEDAMLRDNKDVDVVEAGTTLRLGKEVKFVEEPTVVAEEEEIFLEHEDETPQEEGTLKTDEALKESSGKVETESAKSAVPEEEKQSEKNDFTEQTKQVTNEQKIFDKREDIQVPQNAHHEEKPNEEQSSSVTKPVDENQDLAEELNQTATEKVLYKATEIESSGLSIKEDGRENMAEMKASQVHSKIPETTSDTEVTTKLDSKQKEDIPASKELEEVTHSKDIHSKTTETKSDELPSKSVPNQSEENLENKEASKKEKQEQVEEEDEEIEEEEEEEIILGNSKVPSKPIEEDRAGVSSTKLDARRNDEKVETKIVVEDLGKKEEEVEEEMEAQPMLMDSSEVNSRTTEMKSSEESSTKTGTLQYEAKGERDQPKEEEEEEEEEDEEEEEVEEQDQEVVMGNNSKLHSKVVEVQSNDQISIKTHPKQEDKKDETKQVATKEEELEKQSVTADSSEVNSKAMEVKSTDDISIKTKQKVVTDTSKVHSKATESNPSDDSTTKLLANQMTKSLKTDEEDQKQSTGVRFAEPERSTKELEGEDEDSSSYTYSDSTQQKTPPKEAFWLIFSGEYTKAMSKDWHSGHFCCWQCDESLTGQRYVLRDDHPYCIKCYESVFANTCEECSKIIGIDSKDLSYKDKHWHEACFLCNKCRVSLVDKQFGSKADKIYCGNCYDAQFASRCDGCGEIFRAGTKKMEYKTRQWHEKCFCCCVCKTPIGTKSFIPREQEIYCATCYEEKFATRCVKCNKIITSGGVTYKNEPWHRECFTCTHCNTSLAGQRFTSRDEKPYCADCFGELFAKRCTSCSRPITGIGGTRFISFEDRHWHNDCFICASCKTSLVGRGFITDGDDIICPECAKQKLM